MNAAEYLADLSNTPALSLIGPNRASIEAVVKQIRCDIAGARKQGALPPEAQVSVRRTNYNSLHISLVAWPGAVFAPAYVEHVLEHGTRKEWDPDAIWSLSNYRREPAHLAEAVLDALWLLERIAQRHIYDRSDVQSDYFDVGFYLHVDAKVIDAHAMHGLLLESDPAFAALLERATGAVATLGQKWRALHCPKGLAGMSEWFLNVAIRTAERAGGREMVHDKRRGWIPQP